MTWHTIPRDNAWREVTIGKAVADGACLWIHCACGKQQDMPAAEIAERHEIPLDTPLLALAMRMRCSACNTRRVQVWRRPYSAGGRT